jgi:solute carrier family 25 folate transporter 32
MSTPWHYRSTLDAARKMYTTEGMRSFYSGLSPALLGLTHVAVHIPVYELLKQKFTGQPLGAPPALDDDSDEHDHSNPHGHHHHHHVQGTHWLGVLAASIMSKILASSATYPHEVIRTRMQTQRRPMAGESFLQGMGVAVGEAPSSGQGASAAEAAAAPKLKYHGVVQTFNTIMKEEGWRAFYAGMGTNMIRAVPAATVTFLTYEYVMATLNQAQADGSRIVRGRGRDRDAAM